MNQAANHVHIDKLVAAVLYEGYLLYPYRPSVKNTQRWTIGGLYPHSYCAARRGEHWNLQCQCLIEGDSSARLDAAVGFLHLIERIVDRDGGGAPTARRAEPAWQEAAEEQAAARDVRIADLIPAPRTWSFHFRAQSKRESIASEVRGCFHAARREQRALEVALELSAKPIEVSGADGAAFQITARVANITPFAASLENRNEALLSSLASTHLVLNARGGEFVSLTDPPAAWREAASACRNERCWPVLVGQPPDRSTVLAAPIILYDYPQIAAESPGALFDSTEIDEILTLRIMTLSDDEKLAMAAADPRTRALLERVESLAPDQLLALHGATRDA